MFVKPYMYLSVWKVKDECCCGVLMRWYFVPGVSVGGIQKTNTYTVTMLLPFEVWSYVLDVMKITPLTQTCALSQTDCISFLPSSIWVITVFPWKAIALGSLFWHTKKTQRTSLFLIAASTVTVTNQNNWKLLGHIKYWRISLLVSWCSLHKQINLLPYGWHALLATKNSSWLSTGAWNQLEIMIADVINWKVQEKKFWLC